VVDAGNLIAPAQRVADAERWQRQVKAELLLEAVSTMGIDAMTVGGAEFAFGRDFLLSHAKSLNLPYVCANLVYTDSGAPVFPPTMVKELGGVKVGILGLAPENLVADGVRATEPIQAARDAVASLKKQGATLVVALSNQQMGVNETLAREMPEIQVIVAGGTRQKTDTPREAGDGVILEAGSRGKFLGIFEMTLLDGAKGWKDTNAQQRTADRTSRFKERVAALQARLATATDDRERERLGRQIEFYNSELEKARVSTPVKGHKNIYHNEQVALATEVQDAPAIKALVDRALARMASPPPPEAMAEVMAAAAATPAPATFGSFVGAQVCMGCHIAEYQQWQATPHAHAYATLEKEKRQQDYQCYGCHITGHGQAGGPTNPAAVGNMTNVQCEACHTAGREHVADPKGHPLPAEVSEHVCLTCHTKDQTGDRFVYTEYLPKIMHVAAVGASAAAGVAPPAGGGR
jgi:hypothetical protein